MKPSLFNFTIEFSYYRFWFKKEKFVNPGHFRKSQKI